MITINFDMLDFKKGYKILDIGCGSGRHLVAIHHHITTLGVEDVISVGSDISIEDLELAKERMIFQNRILKKSYKSWELMSSDITNLPFSNKSFDLIICSEVLEHVHDDRSAIKELARILKPGKILAISVPRYWPEKVCWHLSDDYANSDNKHIRIYRKKKLINLLITHGLFCYHTHYAHSLHTPFWILKCLTGLKTRGPFLVDLYHRFLVWDMMQRPAVIKILEKLFNPFFGKSLVMYTAKINEQ